MNRVETWHLPARRRAWLRWLAVTIFCVGSAVYAPSLVAQDIDRNGDRITSIEVEGSQRIEPETVFTYMKIQPGDIYNPADMDASLKALFESGLFHDVSMAREGARIVVSVVENPIINQLVFEGNDRVKDDELEVEVQLQSLEVYTRRKVESDVARIMQVYRRSGRFAAVVEPKIIELGDNRVDLVFEIEEGPSTGVRSIDFIGNSAFSDRQLRSVVSTKETVIWRFFSNADRYDPDRVAFDAQLLRDFHKNSGYADFEISSSIAELTQDEEDFIITYTIDEGPRYRYGTVEITSEIPGLDATSVAAGILTDEGDWYNSAEIEASTQAISRLAQSQNFPFADVRIIEEKDQAGAVVDLFIEVFDGPRIFVERIDIKGNVRTHDRVIRREISFSEGDPYNIDAVRGTNARLERLGFFSTVDVQARQGSGPDKAIVDVRVAEKSTGSIELAGGFSSRVGALAQISFRESNLMGRAQDLRIALTLAAEESQVDLSFTEPRFLGRNINAGFDVFRRLTDLGDQSSFDEDTSGASVRLGYRMTRRWRHTVAYQFQRTDLKNVQAGASSLITTNAGVTLQSLVTNEFFYNALDRRSNPTNGHFFSYSVDVAGLGGNVRYARNTVAAGFFRPFMDRKFVFGIDGEVGYIVGLGKNVRITDMFFLGGDRLRGFDDAGIGPRDVLTGDAVGGKLMANATVELQFPNFLPESLGISTAVFSDVGLLTGTDQSIPSLRDTGHLRASVGLGVSWQSPLGPFRVDFATPLAEETFDVTEGFRISVGTSF